MNTFIRQNDRETDRKRTHRNHKTKNNLRANIQHTYMFVHKIEIL